MLSCIVESRSRRGPTRGFHRAYAAFDKCFKENGMIMCLCSRVPSGRVVRSPRRGFVAGDNLQPWKARLLLALALTKTTNAEFRGSSIRIENRSER
jgi:L-asparaginase/Glu-tRNA(Gln) amidotransferase subunit D